MDRVSRAVLMMIAAAIFGMSLLIAYGASDLKSAQDAKIEVSPTETVEIIRTPAPIDAAADEEVADEVDDEDFEDFGKPVIDLDGEEDAVASSSQDAADAATAIGEAADAAGEAAAAGAELADESASQ